MTNFGPVSLDEVVDAIDAPWQPRIAVQFNGYDARVARFEGEFAWHVHEDVDEFFLILDGEVTILVREDGRERAVPLGPHDTFVVPRGVEHKPVADEECWILLFEPASTLNTGNVVNERTLPELERV